LQHFVFNSLSRAQLKKQQIIKSNPLCNNFFRQFSSYEASLTFFVYLLVHYIDFIIFRTRRHYSHSERPIT